MYVKKIRWIMPVAGGLIGIGTSIDPAYTKGNSLVGHIITYPGKQLDMTIQPV